MLVLIEIEQFQIVQPNQKDWKGLSEGGTTVFVLVRDTNLLNFFFIIFQNQLYYLQTIIEGMLKYTLTGKQTLADLMNKSPTQYHNFCNNALDPKYLPTPHGGMAICKKSTGQMSSLGYLTLKTPRASCQNHNSNNTSFNRSNNVTPDKDNNKKETSFTTPVKYKKLDLLETSLPTQNGHNKYESKSARTDRSHRMLKTTVFRDIANKESDKWYLRQTVSNANMSKLNNILPPTPIKLNNKTNKDKDLPPKQEPMFRKKNVSEYISVLPPENNPKDIKLKISSTTHSRKNSDNNYQQGSNKGLQKLTFKSKNMPYTEYSNRATQDRLADSRHVKNDNLMSQTDPSANYFQLAISRKVSGQLKRQPVMDLKIQDFQLGPCKGEGRFGKVYAAIHKKTGWMVAIKQIKKQEVRLMLDQFVQEIKINLFANHPNIVKMYGFFSDRTYFYIMMEYMEEGSLYKAIKLAKKMKQEQTCQKLYQICDAVNYLHSNDILHRDIKPQNIVLSNGVSKLCDFGWAIYSKQRRQTYCGTLDYVCPQILQGQSYDNFVDIWAIGVLAYEMLTGKAPFYHISRKETMKSIMNCEFSFPHQMTVNAKYFIKKALKKNPDQRFTISSLLQDKFLSGCSQRH